MLSTLSNLLRTKVKTPEAAQAAKDISLRSKPVYQGDLDDIEMYFMAAVKEIKKEMCIRDSLRAVHRDRAFDEDAPLYGVLKRCT